MSQISRRRDRAHARALAPTARASRRTRRRNPRAVLGRRRAVARRAASPPSDDRFSGDDRPTGRRPVTGERVRVKGRVDVVKGPATGRARSMMVMIDRTGSKRRSTGMIGRRSSVDDGRDGYYGFDTVIDRYDRSMSIGRDRPHAMDVHRASTRPPPVEPSSSRPMDHRRDRRARGASRPPSRATARARALAGKNARGDFLHRTRAIPCGTTRGRRRGRAMTRWIPRNPPPRG